MTMPIDLILVRHGESEGNIANKRSRAGDHKAFTEEFLLRPSSRWRLTNKGIFQAQTAGNWIKDNIGEKFDRYYVSECLRAMETASYLQLEDAKWNVDFNLRERDFGDIDVISDIEKQRKFGDELNNRERNPFFWVPPGGGESLANLSLRLHKVLSTLCRERGNKRVIIVSHGDVMWAFRVMIERMSQERFHQLYDSNHLYDKILNCQVLHYTRRNPFTNQLMPYMYWMRSVCTTDLSFSKNKWELIVRPEYNNEDLLKEVEKETRMIVK